MMSEIHFTLAPIMPRLKHVLYKVKDRLYGLVPIIFVGLVTNIKARQCELTANAKLEATIKSKTTLNMAKLLNTDLPTSQGEAAPKNMKDLINTVVVDMQLDDKGKQAQNIATKTALQAAQKQSSGEVAAIKTPPRKHSIGSKQKG
jgi:hypothetical protein